MARLVVLPRDIPAREDSWDNTDRASLLSAQDDIEEAIMALSGETSFSVESEAHLMNRLRDDLL